MNNDMSWHTDRVQTFSVEEEKVSTEENNRKQNNN